MSCSPIDIYLNDSEGLTIRSIIRFFFFFQRKKSMPERPVYSVERLFGERSWVLGPAASIINYEKSSGLMASSSGSVIVLLCDFEQVMPLFGPQCSYVWSEGSGFMASRVISRFHISGLLQEQWMKGLISVCIFFSVSLTHSEL